LQGAVGMGTAAQTEDFVIEGPALAPGNKVFESIHALYFLPEHFKLVFTGSDPVERAFYEEVVSLVERDELGDRVHFLAQPERPNARIVPDLRSTAGKSIAGDSPEALASAILRVSRATT
jgi:hypothetical protein